MKRTILYYPTISIPDGKWLRQALFYFDEVASIVPQRVYFSGESGELLVPLTPELEFLRAEGAFRPIAPEALFLEQGWLVAHQLGDEFEAVFNEEGFQTMSNARYVRLHRDKLADTTMQFLRSKGLLGYDAPENRWYEAEWLLVEERSALLYMSMLAQYLADLDTQLIVPGTDRREYENQIYHARAPENGFAGVETHFRAIVPVPRPDVALRDILAFKRRREAELLRYRARIDELQQQVAKAEKDTDVKEALVRFEETQRRELQELVDVLNDARLATVWGSVKTLIKADSPTFWGSAGVAVGLATGVVSLPISFVVGGVAVSGAVEVGSYLVDRRNERRATERKAAFAYLYHAKTEGIL